MVTKGLKLHVLASFKNWSKTETTRKAGYNQFEIDQYNEVCCFYTQIINKIITHHIDIVIV